MLIHRWRLSAFAVVALLAACVLSACGSSAASPAASTSGSSTSAHSAAIAADQALVNRLTRPPTIGIDTPIGKSIPKDKYLVIVQPNTPSGAEVGNLENQIAKSFGWKTRMITFDLSSPDTLNGVFESVAALSPKPNFVVTSSLSVDSYKAGLLAIKKAGIPFFISGTGDPALGSVNGIYGSVGRSNSFANIGDGSGAWIVSNSRCKANVVIFGLMFFPSNVAYANAIKDTVLKACPNVPIDIVPVSPTELQDGTYGSSMVTYLLGHHNVNYLVVGYGGGAPGLGKLLAAAGLSDKVKVTSQTVSLDELQDVRSGEMKGALMGVGVKILAWEMMDGMARMAAGLSVAPTNNTLLPTQILTQANIQTPIQVWEPPNTRAQYLKLWGM
jgi:hypothetical protein